MKMSEITATLAAAELPALSKEQLLVLAGTEVGKRFASSLQSFDAGQADARVFLDIVVRALAPSAKVGLERAGLRFDLVRFVRGAEKAGRGVFAALHAVNTNGRDRDAAIAYLRGADVGEIVVAGAEPAASSAPYYSFKLFGKAAALCISEARTRTGNQHTIQIEGAHAVGSDRSAPYDWPNKTIIQLTTQECYQALALFENRIASVRFDGHGQRHDKCLHIDLQGAHYFVKIIARGKAPVGVPVRPVDALPIVSLLYRQIQLNEPHLEVSHIQSMLDRMAGMMA